MTLPASAPTPSLAPLLLAAAALLTAPLPAQDSPPPADPLRIRVEQIRPGIHVVSGYTNGNILVVESDDGILLVDAQSARRAIQADSAIRAISAKPVRVVVNTHYHPDHTEGNALFRRRGASVIAHENVPGQARKDTVIASWDNWHRTPLADSAMPTELFRDSTAVAYGTGARAVVLHLPRAHTDGDAVVWLPDADVIHVGDILEREAYPFVDWWAGGTIDGMIAAIDRIAALAGPSTVIVPGHGAVATRSDLAGYRAMLVAVRDRVAEALRLGLTTERLLAAWPAAPGDLAFGSEGSRNAFIRLIHLGMGQRDPRVRPVHAPLHLVHVFAQPPTPRGRRLQRRLHRRSP